MNALTLVGQFYVFEDGNKIEVIQVKKTDEDRGDYLVTYHVSRGPNIPQKLVLPVAEFLSYYSHLFDVTLD
mgnify:FL=1|jgi:hypothetical protein